MVSYKFHVCENAHVTFDTPSFFAIGSSSLFTCSNNDYNLLRNLTSELRSSRPSGCLRLNRSWKSNMIKDTSSCPWNYRKHVDPLRFPSVLINATLKSCIIRQNYKCIDFQREGDNRFGKCVPIITSQLVFRTVSHNNGLYTLMPEKVSLVTGYTCVYSSIGAIHTHGVGNAVCSFPCEQQERAQYIFITGGSAELTSLEYFRNQSHLVQLSPSGEFAECHFRTGPFLVARRRGNEYTCVKRLALDPTGGIVVWYGLPWRRENQIRRSSMGCNVPKNCPIRNPRLDIPCTGCEPVEDDGLCCARETRCHANERSRGYRAQETRHRTKDRRRRRY
ncbi:unnamed protein product [Mytilus edulis]|uniref:Uncharacterized protein n=1 Tax=Mytilus edulis TaxID=6550 RepID=A0A8S3PPA5_MYTED|nr:unnamed protein product [Mytilus edulis]